MSHNPRFAIHVVITDSKGGQLVYWRGIGGGKDIVIRNTCAEDAETAEARIGLHHLKAMGPLSCGIEEVTSNVLSGDRWQDLEANGASTTTST